MLQTFQKDPERYPFWLWPNLVGLDAPLVAISWQILFTRCFGVAMPWVIHAVLGLSVWCIYLADRLYDIHRASDFQHATARLSFTKNHFKAIAAMTALAGLINIYLIVGYVPNHLIRGGLVTAGLLGIYYGLRFRRSGEVALAIPREVMCGMIFAIGSAIATFSYGFPNTLTIRFFTAVTVLGVVCSVSCILISMWERDADLAVGDLSLASAATGGPKQVRCLLISVATAYLVFGLPDPWEIHLAAVLSGLALYRMIKCGDNMHPSILRVLADGVLLTPLLLIWLN